MRRVLPVVVLLGVLGAPGSAAAAEPTGRYLVVFEKPSVARSASLLDRVLDRT
jgi:hypothetical protein